MILSGVHFSTVFNCDGAIDEGNADGNYLLGSVPVITDNVRPHLSVDTEVLSVDLELLESISADTFRTLPNLRKLNLVCNNVVSVYPDSFRHNFLLAHLVIVSSKLLEIHRHLFTYTPKLEYVVLEIPQLEFLDGYVFRANLQLRHVSLWGRLENILPETFETNNDLEYVSLANNRLKSLPKNIFENCLKLKVVDLSHNGLHRLSPETFDTVTNLHTLILAGNHFESINIFKRNGNLKALYLSQNNITSLDSALQYLPYLEELYVDSNKLECLKGSDFQRNRMLRVLNVSHNELQMIGPDVFFNLSHLTHLSLSDNNIVSLHRHSLRWTVKLKHFSIERNKLQMISVELFKNAPSLTEIHMDGNKISTLDRLTFAANSQLIVLTISNNSIVELSEKLFEYNPYLWKLDVSNNNLMDLDLRGMDFLTELGLGGNHWHCDCFLKPMADILSDFDINIIGRFPLCITPKHLQGLDIYHAVETINCFPKQLE